MYTNDDCWFKMELVYYGTGRAWILKNKEDWNDIHGFIQESTKSVNIFVHFCFFFHTFLFSRSAVVIITVFRGKSGAGQLSFFFIC